MPSFLLFIACLFRPWTWTMAWRDSRRSRGKLLVYTSSIILGIAALTAISSFGIQMREAMANQAKALLGADLVVSSRDPLNDDQNAFLASLGGEQSREITFGSMVLFPNSGGTRLIQVRAIQGGFPFFGDLVTSPPSAIDDYRNGRGALIEQSLLDLYQAKIGDPVKIGDLTLPIAGTLTAVPGETAAMGSIAPRVFVSLDRVLDSPMLGQGSLVNYKIYFRFPPQTDVESLTQLRQNEFRALKLRFDTVEERKRDLGRSLDQLLKFLSLTGLTALLLGGIGVAGGVHVHMKQKLASVATLRCLGTSVPQAFAIYFAQAMALGLAGAVAGALLGALAQVALQASIADFLPIDLTASISWPAVLNAIAFGFAICLLFALLPLLPLRRVSPLAAIRASAANDSRPLRDPLVWLLYTLAAAGLAAFAISQSRNWQTGLAYAAAIATAISLLGASAWLLSRIARRIIPASWPFVWRHGFSNLHRPDNRTVLLMQSLGTGVFLVLTMFLIQASLIDGLLPKPNSVEGNTVLFDIQSDQREGVLEILQQQNLPLVDQAPMISMRLHSLKGRTIREIRREQGRGNWALGREYRSTYRENLTPSEKLVAGTWHPRVESLDLPVPISMERDLARRLDLQLGDDLVFDIQGIQVSCTLASLREVDWRRLSPNFFVVFPAGAIEAAPAVHAVVTRIDNSEASARLQREVVGKFPNISAVDLTLVIQTINDILGKVSQVIRFMALFIVGTGLLVLTGAITGGRQQRIRESILLRTLGATRSQIIKSIIAEYVLLGILAALNGIVLANLAAWAAGRWIFETPYTWRPIPTLIALASITTITLIAGLLGNRRILDRPPLEVLRVEP